MLEPLLAQHLAARMEKLPEALGAVFMHPIGNTLEAFDHAVQLAKAVPTLDVGATALATNGPPILFLGKSSAQVGVGQRVPVTLFLSNPTPVPVTVTLYIVPLLNPDGAVAGVDRIRGRMNANTVDLNRNWDTVDPVKMPEIAAQRKAILDWVDAGHRLDLFLSQGVDPARNALFRGLGGGAFERMTNSPAGTDIVASFSAVWADFNRDGRPDIWVANYERESLGLSRGGGRGQFPPVSRRYGITALGGLFVAFGLRVALAEAR